MGKNWKKAVRRSENSAQAGGYFDPNPDLGGDEGRMRARAAFIEVAENRIRNDPDTKATVDRLIGEGISEFDAKMFIANLVSREVFTMLKYKESLDREVYLKWLKDLPELPSD